MAYWIKHKFQSAKGDGTDSTRVRPSNWNDDHEFWMDEGTIVGRPPGAGAGPGQEIPLSSLFPTGMVTPFAGGAAPAGWLLCDGASLLRIDYPALFTAISTAYGAADASHFNVPDLRGRVVAGVDPGVGRIGAHIQPYLGGVGGAEAIQYYADIGGSCSVSVSVSGGCSGGTGAPTGGQGTGNLGGGGTFDYVNHNHGHNFSGSFSGGGSGSGTISGGGYTRSGSNAQPTIVLNYMIKT